MVATLGPEAWPAPPLDELAERIAQPRHLHPMLRDQRVIAGIGRSWVDEVLWEARLSPFKQRLGPGGRRDRAPPRRAAVLGDAIDHYEQVIGETVPDKLPMPLRSTGAKASPARAATPRWRRSTSPSTSPATARRADRRPGAQGPPPVAAVEVNPRLVPAGT